MLSLIISILALGFIILFHELGHFSIAKLFGVSVVEFNIGMGTRLLSFVKGETRYSLRLLPLGGSCIMLGEELDESGDTDAATAGARMRKFNNLAPDDVPVTADKDTITVDGRVYSADSQFSRKEPWKRFLIILAGPLFNFILAFVLSLIITLNIGWSRPVIVGVADGSPAQEIGLEAGDLIRSLSIRNNKTKIRTTDDIMLFFQANSKLISQQEPVSIEFEKPDSSLHKGDVTARFDEESERYLIGISYSMAYEPCSGFSEALVMSFHNLVYTFQATVESIRMMFRGEVSSSDVKGVIGMVQIMDETVEEASGYGFKDAFLTLINIMMLLSASLGFMNLLPLPALDGGRLVFILIEMITGKAVPKKIESYIHFAGMILLIILTIIIMFNDIINLF